MVFLLIIPEAVSYHGLESFQSNECGCFLSWFGILPIKRMRQFCIMVWDPSNQKRMCHVFFAKINHVLFLFYFEPNLDVFIMDWDPSNQTNATVLYNVLGSFQSKTSVSRLLCKDTPCHISVLFQALIWIEKKTCLIGDSHVFRLLVFYCLPCPPPFLMILQT